MRERAHSAKEEMYKSSFVSKHKHALEILNQRN